MKDTLGCTPLHYAVQNGHSVAALRLLEAGSDSSIRNADGLTPLGMLLQKFGISARAHTRDAPPQARVLLRLLREAGKAQDEFKARAFMAGSGPGRPPRSGSGSGSGSEPSLQCSSTATEVTGTGSEAVSGIESVEVLP